MPAAQLEARRKAGLSTSNPTHACSGAVSNAKPDCGEKRDPDKRSLIIQKKENELDPVTQLEKQSFAALRMNDRDATPSLRSALARRPDESRSDRPTVASQNSRSPQCRFSEAVLRAQRSIRIYIAVLSYYTPLGISGSETRGEVAQG
ncbi:MAG: hypothetical protein COB29_00740 [Sulfitobacter sp.]|jgi:hypothetical protein|nr:hypothetical protein [Roseobacter sp.]MBV47659.1 hypothetical protein [Roseobacter sp.]PHR10167.1 MAG: hypothetical protein COB29_00740 [Sulfitobacter sp.]|tara:strand:- start:2702 stop:3145 length:444 start_codon:yes stop_codon:yes gene_type:complete